MKIRRDIKNGPRTWFYILPQSHGRGAVRLGLITESGPISALPDTQFASGQIRLAAVSSPVQGAGGIRH